MVLQGNFLLVYAGFMALETYASGMVTAVYGKHFIVGILFAAVLAAVAV